jgi:hypothetical protein
VFEEKLKGFKIELQAALVIYVFGIRGYDWMQKLQFVA